MHALHTAKELRGHVHLGETEIEPRHPCDCVAPGATDDRVGMMPNATRLLPACCALSYHHERRPIGWVCFFRVPRCDQCEHRTPHGLRPADPGITSHFAE